MPARADPPYPAAAARSYLVGSQGSVFGGVPLANQFWKLSSQIILTRSDLPVSAHRATTARCPGLNLSLPLMSVLTSPPDRTMAAGQHLIRPQFPVTCGVPLSGQVRV